MTACISAGHRRSAASTECFTPNSGHPTAAALEDRRDRTLLPTATGSVRPCADIRNAGLGVHEQTLNVDVTFASGDTLGPHDRAAFDWRHFALIQVERMTVYVTDSNPEPHDLLFGQVACRCGAA